MFLGRENVEQEEAQAARAAETERLTELARVRAERDLYAAQAQAFEALAKSYASVIVDLRVQVALLEEKIGG